MEMWKKMWVGVFFLNTVYVGALCIPCVRLLDFYNKYSNSGRLLNAIIIDDLGSP